MLTVAEALDRAQMLCDAATKAGADAADALYYCNAATSVSMRLGALEDVERSEGQDISLRVFVGQRSASVSTADMDAAELAKLVERCVAMAREAPTRNNSSIGWIRPTVRGTSGMPIAVKIDAYKRP